MLLLLWISFTHAWDLHDALRNHLVHKKKVRHAERMELSTNVEGGNAADQTIEGNTADQTYRDADGLSYYEAVNMCKTDGKRICELNEYCPTSEGGKVVKPLRGIENGDRWAPIGDSFNEWIQLGTDMPERLCKTHSNCCASKPQWGQLQSQVKMSECAYV